MPKAQQAQNEAVAQNSHEKIKSVPVDIEMLVLCFTNLEGEKDKQTVFTLALEKTSESENVHSFFYKCKTSTFQTLTISGRQRRQGKGEILTP